MRGERPGMCYNGRTRVIRRPATIRHRSGEGSGLMTYVAIEGVIGAGKTTLARLLQPELGGTLVMEVFEENPFLSRFYEDRARYAFQTQMFFLLSRYHQQRSLRLMSRPLVSDYIFAKDALFASVNLGGDELEMYQRVHSALAEQVETPDLLIYLRADTDRLMQRIALRDRPYERNMERDYIDSLRRAYDAFFTAYDAGPALVLETNTVDFVANPQDRAEVLTRILAALGRAPRQESLPGFNGELSDSAPSTDEVPSTAAALAAPPPAPPDLSHGTRRLREYQEFHHWLDETKDFNPDLLFNFVKMQEEIGELARLVAILSAGRNSLSSPPSLAEIGYEMADVLAYLLKLANYLGVDLEAAYLEKMQSNLGRRWR
jgi:deoxyguanosine kinase